MSPRLRICDNGIWRVTNWIIIIIIVIIIINNNIIIIYTDLQRASFDLQVVSS